MTTLDASTKLFYSSQIDYDRNWYTDREWQRSVGWGTVPDEYKKPDKKLDKDKVGYQYDLFIDIE
jgi:hypothetical protein